MGYVHVVDTAVFRRAYIQIRQHFPHHDYHASYAAKGIE